MPEFSNVWYEIPKSAEEINTDGLFDLAQSLLFIRGVWRQVRIYATEHGDAFESHTKLVYV